MSEQQCIRCTWDGVKLVKMCNHHAEIDWLQERLAAAEAALKTVDDAIAYWGVERSQTTLERIETALNKYQEVKGGRE